MTPSGRESILHRALAIFTLMGIRIAPFLLTFWRKGFIKPNWWFLVIDGAKGRGSLHMPGRGHRGGTSAVAARLPGVPPRVAAGITPNPRT